MSDQLDSILAHAGVKGMKWGVRKSRSSGGGSLDLSKKIGQIKSSRRKQKLLKEKRKHDDALRRERRKKELSELRDTNARELKNKPFSKMSNAELRQYVERKELMARAKNKPKSAYRELGESILRDAIKKAGTDYATKFISTGLNKLGDSQKLADRVKKKR